ncbi:MAG: peptidyl-prolyl cis-trans isomerase [Paucibacter sp.]|nr:peptidyl-prolyl cis-trans isomerase [Roseateles sp.]
MKKISLLLAALLVGAASQAQVVKFSTSEGDFRVKLDAEKAPKTVANFLQYVKAGFYSGTVFHRVIPTFMVQGGGYGRDLKQKPTKAPIPLESNNGLLNVRGAIAMARTGDPNSATAQFFVNVVDNPFLDAANARDGLGYAVFGQVIEGMDVIDKIRDIPTVANGAFENLPTTPVIINKATVEKQQ